MTADLLDYLPNDILTKVDRASMAVSLEARSPLLDHRLWELSARMSPDLLIREGKTKWPLRRALGNYVPTEIFDRPKTGFGIPIGEWLTADLRDWAEDLLAPECIESVGLLDEKAVRRTWALHCAGTADVEEQVWVALSLQNWALTRE